MFTTGAPSRRSLQCVAGLCASLARVRRSLVPCCATGFANGQCFNVRDVLFRLAALSPRQLRAHPTALIALMASLDELAVAPSVVADAFVASDNGITVRSVTLSAFMPVVQLCLLDRGGL